MTQRFLTSFPNVGKLALANWMRFEASDVESLVTVCPHLQELQLPGVPTPKMLPWVVAAAVVAPRLAAESPLWRNLATAVEVG